MNIFLSWSGERSGRLAQSLGLWLPRVIQAARPWLSSGSVDAGARWSDELANAIERLHCGVLCLTPENLSAPWILFEAGALSKAVSASRVVPYLLGFEPRELEGPLAQFQAVRADEPGTLRLLSAINNLDGAPLLRPEALAEAFQMWWPQLQSQITDIAAVRPTHQPHMRSLEDMMGEVLQILRTQRVITEAELVDAASTESSVNQVGVTSFGLTPRELEILVAITDGHSNIEIARKFALSEKTVKTHLTRLFDK